MITASIYHVRGRGRSGEIISDLSLASTCGALIAASKLRGRGGEWQELFLRTRQRARVGIGAPWWLLAFFCSFAHLNRMRGLGTTWHGSQRGPWMMRWWMWPGEGEGGGKKKTRAEREREIWERGPWEIKLQLEYTRYSMNDVHTQGWGGGQRYAYK